MASTTEIKRRLSRNERELRSLGGLTLTTQRVILYSRSRGGEASTSIALGHVQWTRLEQVDRRMMTALTSVLAAFALVTLLVGETAFAWPLCAALLVVGPICVFRSRARLIVGAGRHELTLPIEPTAHRRRQARDLADAIEHAAIEASRAGPALHGSW